MQNTQERKGLKFLVRKRETIRCMNPFELLICADNY